MTKVSRVLSTLGALLALGAVTSGCVVHAPGHWRREWRQWDGAERRHHDHDDFWRERRLP